MAFSSKRGSHIEDPIFSLLLDKKWILDVLYLDYGVIKTTDGKIRVTYNIENKKIIFQYDDMIPKSVQKKIIKELKL
jgi:hypothetical protein